MTVLQTERLILRPIDPERDFDGWARAMGDEDTVRYLTGKVMSRADAWRNMAMVMGHWQIRGFGFFSLEEKTTGDWVGRVGPWNPHGWPQPEVGWTISPDHLRKGYATEAGRAAIDYAFSILGWEHVAHVILEGNRASVATAEKLGSAFLRREARLPGVTDEAVLVFGQSAPNT
ncbi:MAG: GNAT family N-acetyltransferase [Gammaproteobacteria bacterium]